MKDLFAKQRILGHDQVLNGLTKVDALLAELIYEGKVPGLSVSVLKDGITIFQKGYGYSDLEVRLPVDPNKTLFRIASVSKPIAATALAHMVAEGLIDLDASFYEYVPYYPKKKWDFTIRQLASHTAGIRGYRGVEYGLNQPYTIKEGIDIFKNDPLIFEPGKGYLYNSYDWVLVSLAMQEASGIPFEEYVRQRVLEHLAMENTFPESPSGNHFDKNGEDGRETDGTGDVNYREDTTHTGNSNKTEDLKASDALRTSKDGPKKAWPSNKIFPHVSKFYTKNRRGGFREAIPVNNFYKLAGGGYLSTSADIAKFGQAHLEEAILNESVRAQFLNSQVVNGKPTYYGLGWQISEDAKGRPYYGHVGNGVGGYSNFFVYPEAGMVFAILLNCTDPKVQEELNVAIATLVNLHKVIDV
ncbi:serine hydrolase domain-containing protein [Pricia sp. S334]|uniref:Serine hydrolase domain-containing protein n=1 Tax=Pricia mediterranea TaxID=3076079 RepID=A0ABU3L4I2_9FLAO|nr:serine hydrolase domain-containing protein [Pricia sp. S334]MDT7828114.1 serine hydrolase domain-containing protein [Pricia sp. S334]